MTIVFLGISFIIQAIFHGLGNPYFITKKYRGSDFCKEYQKGLVFPYSFLGIGWIILGITNPRFEQLNSASFCLWLVIIAIIPFVLLIRNKRKFNL